MRRLAFPTPGLCLGHYLRYALPTVGDIPFCHTPLFHRGNNSEKHGKCPGTDQGFTTGIIEVMYSNVLLASGRANRGLAKPRGPGEGVRNGGSGIRLTSRSPIALVKKGKAGQGNLTISLFSGSIFRRGTGVFRYSAKSPISDQSCVMV